MKILNILDDLLKSGENRISAAVRILPVKYIECHSCISVLLSEISITHGQLIKVHDHR